MNKKQLIVAWVMIILLNSLAYAEETPGVYYYDGFMWEKISEESKLTYVVAFFDGFSNCNSMIVEKIKISAKSYKTISGDSVAKDIELQQKWINDTYIPKDKSTLLQVVGGLNKFYEDYANKKIPVSIAYMIVLLRIRGFPEDEVQKHIEGMRRVTNKILLK